MLLLMAALQAARAEYVVDKACIGSTREYRIEGEAGSTYLWLLYDSLKKPVALINPNGTPFDEPDPVSGIIIKQGSSISIQWTQLGVFKLAAIQYSKFSCDTLEQGDVEVFPQPVAFAGNPQTICSGAPLSLSQSTASNYGSLLWTSPGDGTFDNPSVLHPVYQPGIKDMNAGGVTLMLTAQGKGNGTSCFPAISTVQVTIVKLTAQANKSDITCFGANNGRIVIINAKGGSGSYEFMIDGKSWDSSTIFSNLKPGIYPVKMRDVLMQVCISDLGSLTIVEPPQLEAIYDYTNTSCLGNDGTITISNPKGGWGNYEFSVDNLAWQSGMSFINLTPGNYNVSIRDANYQTCSVILGPVTITAPTKLSASAVGTPVTCFGANDGMIAISNAVGGSGIHQFSIDGSIWSSTLRYNALAPASYKVQMRDANTHACVVDVAVINITGPTKLNAVISPHDITCFGSNDGVIDIINATGGSGLYEFSKDGSSWQAKTQFANLTQGTYTISIRDAKIPSCIVVFNPVIIHEPPQMSATVQAINITCFGSNDGRILISKAAGGSGSHEFSKDGVNWTSLPEFNKLSPASYTVQMRDATMHSCIVQLGTWAIIEPAILHAVVDYTNTTCLDNDGTITLSNPTGGSGNFEYSIDGASWQASRFFTGLLPKFYQVRIRDAKQISCWLDLESIQITKPVPLSATASGKDISCFGGQDGVVTFANVIGGSGFYEFSVDGLKWIANPAIGNLSIGTYPVKMRDAKTITCVLNVASIIIGQPNQMSAILTPLMVSCFGDSDGKIMITNPVGGSGSYQYSVNGSVWTSTPEIKNLPIGNYIVQMRDAKALLCVVNLPALVITQPAQLQAVVKSDNITCFGSKDGKISISGSVGGSGSFEYSITGTSWTKNLIYNNLAKGKYKVEMRDANTITCFVTLANIEIVEPKILAGDVIPKNTTCSGNDGTITISNSSGGWGTYEYSINNINWQTVPLFTGLIAGTYPVSIRDAVTKTCVILLETIIIKSLVDMDAIPDHLDITCFGANNGKISFLNPSGGSGNYEFTVDGGTKWQASPFFENLSPGNFNLLMRDANSKNCVKVILNSFTLTEPQILAASVTSVNETYTTAKDGSITITNPSGGSKSYVYSIDGVNWQNSGTFTNLGPNTYKVWIADAKTLTCTLQLGAKIITTIVPLLATVTHTPATCYTASDGTITIQPTSGPVGNYEYTIDGGSTWLPTPVFTALPSSNYFVYMRDKAHTGYQALLDNITITRPDKLIASLSSTKESFLGANDGTITVQSPTGGSGTFEYSKDGVSWQASPIFNNLTPGTYSITMRDTKAPACFVTLGSATVQKGNQISAIITPKDVICYGGNTGSLSVSKEGGGSGTYQYSIDNGITWHSKAAFEALTLFYGLYPVTIRDAANTAITVLLGNFKITQPDEIIVSITQDAPIPFFGGTTMVTVSATGGKLPYSGTGTYPVTSGKHTYIVTDASKCTGTSDITVSEPGVITLAAAAVGSPCLGINGSILFTFTNVPDGIYDILYDFTSFKNVSIVGNKASVSAPTGNYNNLRLSIGANSTNMVSVEIKQLPPVIISALAINSQCMGVNGSIVFWFNNVPDGKYDIVYDTGIFTGVQLISNWSQIQNVPDGNYTNLKLLISTCSSNTTSVTLDQPVGITPIAVVTEQPTCIVPTGKIVVTYPAFGTGYEYSLNGGAYQSSDTFVASGSNKIRVREVFSGCESQETPVNIDLIPSPPVAPTASVTVQPTCDLPTGTIVISSPFGPYYEFNIDGGLYGTFPSFTGLLSGKHQLRVKNIITGCESAITELTVNAMPPPLAAPLATITKQPDCVDQTGSIVITDIRTSGYLFYLDGVLQVSRILTGLAPGIHQVTIRTKLSNCESDITKLTIDMVPSNPLPPALVGVNPLAECENNPIQTLIANDAIIKEAGIVVKWYDKASGGNLILSPELSKLGSATYYAEAVRGNCVSLTRTMVMLSIYPMPLVQGPAAPVEQCENTPIQLLDANSYITGLKPGEIITWFDAPTGGIIVSPILNTIGNKIFYAEVSNSQCTTLSRVPVNLIINPTPAVPAWVSNGQISDCEMTPIQTLDANDAIVKVPGNTITWYDKASGGVVVPAPLLNKAGTVIWYAEASIASCISPARTPVTLSIKPIPAAPVLIGGSIVECEKNPIQTLDANNGITLPPGASVVWYDQILGGNVVSNPTLNTVNTVTYYAESIVGECAGSPRKAVTLTINPTPDILIKLNPVEECAESPLQTIDARTYVSVKPGVTVNWYDSAVGGNVTLPVLNTIETKTFYAEPFNGQCVGQVRTGITLTIFGLPASPTAKIIAPPSCKDEHGTIEITNPIGPQYEYNIDGGAYQASAIFEHLSSKAYTLQVRNVFTGCYSVAGAVVMPPVPPTPEMKTAAVEDCICFGDSGTINFDFANVADGTYVVVYLGGSFQNVKVFNNKAKVRAIAGTYSILAIEANGCTSAENHNVVISQPDQLSVSYAITKIDLKSGQKGEIDLTISGGTGKYLSVWQPNLQSGFAGAIKEDIFNLNNGDYHVTVTDQNGCLQNLTITLPIPNLPPVATNDEFITLCSEVSGNVVTNDNGYGIDSDPDFEAISNATLTGGPLHGTLTLNPDGSFLYKAFQGYSGDDTFRYVVYDVNNNASNPATVTIQVISDIDHDGIPDELDADADGDGILNLDEVMAGSDWKTTDTDGDAFPNYLDIDSDNDGIVDNIESQSTPDFIQPSGKVNKDGVDFDYDPLTGGTRIIPTDTDLNLADPDGIPDFLDADSDNDHVPDYIEGHDGFSYDGKPDHILAGKDSDGDGLDDGFDTVPNICSAKDNATGSNAAMQDFEGDGIKDWRDENDDNDEYLTQFEDLNMDGDYSNDDIDFDGYPEYLDYGRDCDLFIPNAFSPNDDNIHDYFQIYCLDHFPNARMYIFDQLGNKLYEKNNYGNLIVWGNPEDAWWDGRTTNRTATVINGKVTPGTYFYVLQLGNGEVKKSFVFVSY